MRSVARSSRVRERMRARRHWLIARGALTGADKIVLLYHSTNFPCTSVWVCERVSLWASERVCEREDVGVTVWGYEDVRDIRHALYCEMSWAAWCALRGCVGEGVGLFCFFSLVFLDRCVPVKNGHAWVAKKRPAKGEEKEKWIEREKRDRQKKTKRQERYKEKERMRDWPLSIHS